MVDIKKLLQYQFQITITAILTSNETWWNSLDIEQKNVVQRFITDTDGVYPGRIDLATRDIMEKFDFTTSKYEWIYNRLTNGYIGQVVSNIRDATTATSNTRTITTVITTTTTTTTTASTITTTTTATTTTATTSTTTATTSTTTTTTSTTTTTTASCSHCKGPLGNNRYSCLECLDTFSCNYNRSLQSTTDYYYELLSKYETCPIHRDMVFSTPSGFHLCGNRDCDQFIPTQHIACTDCLRTYRCAYNNYTDRDFCANILIDKELVIGLCRFHSLCVWCNTCRVTDYCTENYFSGGSYDRFYTETNGFVCDTCLDTCSFCGYAYMSDLHKKNICGYMTRYTTNTTTTTTVTYTTD